MKTIPDMDPKVAKDHPDKKKMEAPSPLQAEVPAERQYAPYVLAAPLGHER